MSELEDKINGILGDSEQMAKITELARSLMGGAGNEEGGSNHAPGNDNDGAAGALSEFGLDAAALGKIGRLMSAGSAQSSNEQALLSAMRPYLTEKRRSKMDRAMKLAKLARIAKLALGETEGDGHA
ncbi:MAG: hypothetical protein J6J62_06970 [Oscillospiraceae bacterium]|nr:hypothetical protein [Oscillospiraceae bacterium]